MASLIDIWDDAKLLQLCNEMNDQTLIRMAERYARVYEVCRQVFEQRRINLNESVMKQGKSEMDIEY